jgi:hypothetical protein
VANRLQISHGSAYEIIKVCIFSADNCWLTYVQMFSAVTNQMHGSISHNYA